MGDILSVEYSRLESTNSFSNVKFGAVARVEPYDQAEDVLRELAAWVDGKIAGRMTGEERRSALLFNVSEAERRVLIARAEHVGITAKIARAKTKLDEVLAFLEKHGVDTGELRAEEDYPF